MLRRCTVLKHVLGALLGLATTSATAAESDIARTTAKSVEPFARCFADAQDRTARPWWFVPKAGGGGTFSNLGAKGVAEPYFLDVADRGATREIRLTLVGAAGDRSVLSAVERCI